MQEFDNVLKTMKQATAPGLDDIVTGFYKTFLQELGDTLLEMLNNFILKQKLESFNGHVAPILNEGGNPTETEAWRPISTLNTDYKILMTSYTKGSPNSLRTLSHHVKPHHFKDNRCS